MTKTTNYQLNQWAASDRVLREDFNADNLKIEQALSGLPKIETGSYTGAGTYGASNPNSITFGAKPLFVFITFGNSSAILAYGQEGGTVMMGNSDPAYIGLTWQDNQLSWFSPASAKNQMNIENKTGHYLAVLE